MGQLELFNNREQAKSHLDEYLFVISPDSTTNRDIKLLKEKMHNIIGISQKDITSIPHVSLINFSGKENDRVIIDATTSTLSSVSSFSARIKGVTTFVHGAESKSVVLEFEEPEPIIQLQRLLTSLFLDRKNSYRPHITIAKAISVSAYEQIPSLSVVNYKGVFLCNKITLLKRRVTPDKKHPFSKIHEFVLE